MLGKIQQRSSSTIIALSVKVSAETNHHDKLLLWPCFHEVNKNMNVHIQDGKAFDYHSQLPQFRFPQLRRVFFPQFYIALLAAFHPNDALVKESARPVSSGLDVFDPHK